MGESRRKQRYNNIHITNKQANKYRQHLSRKVRFISSQDRGDYADCVEDEQGLLVLFSSDPVRVISDSSGPQLTLTKQRT